MNFFQWPARWSSYESPAQLQYVYYKSMPRSGHWFLAHRVNKYFGDALHYCEYHTQSACCGKIPCTKPLNDRRINRFFAQKSHDFDLSDSRRLQGKYIVQYRSPIPRLQSYYELYAYELGRDSRDMFRTFAEQQTTYFIRFFKKWIAALTPDDLVISYEELTEHPKRTLTKVVSFIQGSESINPLALQRVLAQTPVLPRPPLDANKSSPLPLGSRNPRLHPHLRDCHFYPYFDHELFAALERRVADACGTDLIRFHFFNSDPLQFARARPG
jgi:hypothetical protein